jgi:hypothetical protein
VSDTPKIVCVVPTCRPESHAKFVAAWTPLFTKHRVTLVTVWDGEEPRVVLNLPEGGYGTGLDITTTPHMAEVWRDHRDLFCRRTDAVRNLGFVAAARMDPDYVLTLDDDCYPCVINDPTSRALAANLLDPIQSHLDALQRRVPLGWMNTAHDTDLYLRGVPYGVRAEAPVMLSHGVWVGTPDFDGECVIGDTEVSVELDGKKQRLKISDAPTGTKRVNRGKMQAFDAPEGMRVLSYDSSTGRSEYRDVSFITVEPDRECVKVTTRRSGTVTVTKNQSLCTYDVGTGTVVPIAPDKAIGRLVPVVRKQGVVGSKHTFDLGWWYGLMVGDGCIQNRSVSFANNNANLRNKFVETSRALFVSESFTVKEYEREKTEGSFGPAAKVCLHGKDFAGSLLSLHADGDKSPCSKQIPYDILHNGSEECLYGVLSGLLDADSQVGWSRGVDGASSFVAKLFTSSPLLVADVEVLLSKLGIRFSVTTTPARGQSTTSYVVSLYAADVRSRAPHIQLQTTEYADAIDEVVRSDVRDQLDIVPVPDSMIPFLDGDTKRVKRVGYVSRSKARTALSKLPATDEAVRWRAVVENEEVLWDVYETVEPAGSHTVYDLVVDSTKVFAVNRGIIVWDTQLRLETCETCRIESAMRGKDMRPFGGCPECKGTGKRALPHSLPYYVGPIPRGVLAPICGMNVMVRREALPYLYYAPMGADSGVPDLHRFADIFMGLSMRFEFDRRKWGIVTGYSTVHHTRASDARKNVEQERLGREWLERMGDWDEPANGAVTDTAMWNYFRSYASKRDRYAALISSLLERGAT